MYHRKILSTCGILFTEILLESLNVLLIKIISMILLNKTYIILKKMKN